MNSDLVHIENIIDGSLKSLSKGNYYQEKNMIIALLRATNFNYSFFYDFLSFLKQLAENDDSFSFYDLFEKHIARVYGNTEYTPVWEYLFANDYSVQGIQNMHTYELNYKERNLLNKLPNNRRILYILIFYVYTPHTVHNFFNFHCTHFLTQEEIRFLTKFRRLDSYSQSLIFENLEFKDYEKYDKTKKSKKSNKEKKWKRN